MSGAVALLLENNSQLTPDQVKCRLMSSAHPAINAQGQPAISIFQQGAGMLDLSTAMATGMTAYANTGLGIVADLDGSQHFGGRENQDVQANYYLMGLSSNGYVWADGYVWTDNTVRVNVWGKQE